MPALTSTNATILVTGANGFLGAWIVEKLLERGYSVRAAVRNQAKGQHLLATNKAYGEKLQICTVGDIGKPGAFDEAMRGVDGVIHVASPVALDAEDPKDLIDTAVNGTTGILDSVLKNGASVKRVVFTSSFTTVLSYPNHPVTVAEDSWNDNCIKDCEENGKNAQQLSKYAASKTLAEKAVWPFYEKHKYEVDWDITVLNPPFILGPILHEVTTVNTLTSSSKYLYEALVEGKFLGGNPLTFPSRGWIDVRDAADAHPKSLEVPAAGSERIIISTDSFVWQDLANSLSLKSFYTIAKGTSGIRVRNVTINTEKEHRILGLEYKTLEDMVRDTFADYVGRGW
ncbi:D-lactaldehyde dehydrogenase [Neolentinus lepideus HHB14362 ss-1]|uniref:D-lactaldehyde dehydrogenase n=1 Tax=Neolentinus lepideus HHB14362 ss-1 TaxID=1314782 RepID=A0A165VNP9_9AGAM|nr:D-lactaldehyde dehydrogenase [Neolentinus lepideus HHB14362 ss-1]